MDEQKSKVGRPRAVPRTSEGNDPREEILDVAAKLFHTYGFSGTSTRLIAEQSGIRQATLYYHFSGKDDILRELLAGSVQPTLVVARERIANVINGADPVAELLSLVINDAAILLRDGRNASGLYGLPELRSEKYREFRDDHDKLETVYAELIEAVQASLGNSIAGRVSAADVARLVIRIPETAYEITSDRQSVEEVAGQLVLQLCGVPCHRIENAFAALELSSLPSPI